jgi:colanic acid/amylovoran biosynthesis glycosyltransferase
MKGPLRIALFAGSFPVISETFIIRQIAGLLALGHQVDVFADTRGPADGPMHPEVARHRMLERTTYMDMPEAVAPYELPIRPLLGRTWTPGAERPTPNVVRLLQALPCGLRCLFSAPRLTARALQRSEHGFQADSLSALYRLAALAPRRGPYDVLHAHFGPAGNSYRFARELWRAPLVVSFHGYDFCTAPRRQGGKMYEKLFQAADAITVNSAFTWGRVAALGCPESKVRRLPMGVDLEAFVFRERVLLPGLPVHLLTVARLVEIKGHEWVLAALARLRKLTAQPFHYHLVGDGPLRAGLEARVREWGLNEVVTLHGARDGEFIRQKLAEAHLAILGSVTIENDAEGQGLFLQEAQACGLPVVATCHGAFPEALVPGQSGWLVPERDPDAMAAQLRRLFDQPALWPEMGRAGRRWVEKHFDLRLLNEQLVELYRQLQRGRPVSGSAT